MCYAAPSPWRKIDFIQIMSSVFISIYKHGHKFNHPLLEIFNDALGGKVLLGGVNWGSL